MKIRIRLLTSLLVAAAPTLGAGLLPDSYKITWTTPSIDSLDSMPLSGRMGAGANVWVQDGSIWLYLAHSGAFDERGRLLKLGCVRITPQEVALGKDGFIQELDPATGTISITQGDFQATLPEIPTGVRHGRKSILAAHSMEREYNKWEPIEMYAYWPYRFAGITKPETLQLARDTWDTIPADRARLCKQDFSWMANVANMAALASPEKAKERAIWKMANTAAPQARFPAFFGPGHDWLPDFNWGGSGMTGIQEMLLAPEPGSNGKLHLFGGWPADWDVDFKLHAPGKTLVEASLKNGKLVSLKVTPSSREKDIVNWLGKHPEWKPFTPPVSLAQGKPITASSQFVEPGYGPNLANDGDPTTRWASDFQARSGSLEIDLGEENEIGSFVVSEIEWKETREFTIEVKHGGAWKEVARGTTIGTDKEIPVAPTKARHVRLNILKSNNAININEFQVFTIP